VPVPVPGHGQIIIRVAYAGVNRPDALQRAGAYAPPPSASPLPGLECSGTVVEVGPGVTRWKIGDRSAPCCRAGAMPNMRLPGSPCPADPRRACR
jgi:NADPH:quinone reductase-like Zn-dependent oxidoreductase